MQILKTWLSILGALAIVFLCLICLQMRRSLASRDAEIARLRGAERPAPVGFEAAPASASARPPENTGDGGGNTALLSMTADRGLLRDGKVQDTARVPVSVPAQGQASWSHKFTWHSSQGSWTATVSVEP